MRVWYIRHGICHIQIMLGVSPKAISKWGNEVTTPDIGLLPQIAVYFGVKIDELFQIPRKEQYERIRNIIYDNIPASAEEFVGLKHKQ